MARSTWMLVFLCLGALLSVPAGSHSSELPTSDQASPPQPTPPETETPAAASSPPSAVVRSDLRGNRPAVPPQGLPSEGGFTLFEIHDAQARGAVCNSGEPARYHVRPGTGARSDHWLLFFKGGGACWTDDDCDERWRTQHQLMRTAGTPQLRTDGLFSNDPTKNPDFHDWNVVFVWSCSSDQWMGDRAASDATGGFHFRGARIVDTLIDDLLHRPVTGMSSPRGAAVLMVGGASAGTGAVRAHGNEIASKIGAKKTFFLHDSGIEPFLTEGFRTVIDNVNRARHAYWNAQPNDACMAAANDPVRCMENIHVLTHHMAHPVFANMDQLDGKATKRQQVARGSSAEANLSKGIRDFLASDTFAGAYSIRRRGHTLVTKDTFFDVSARSLDGQRMSMAHTLANLVYDRGGPTKAMSK